MYAKFKPINDNILVMLTPPETKTSGGIIIPNDAQEKTQNAMVVHAGKSDQLREGHMIYFKKYMGTALNEDYLVLREEDILGVLNV